MGINPGKLLLLGEHAAVYGYPALGVPLPLGVSARLEVPSVRNEPYPGTPDIYHPVLDRLVQTVSGSCLPANASLYLESSLPVGVGLGSSAALCTALVRAFLPGLDAPSVWQQAHQAEALLHGKPSGIDTGLSVYGCALGFYFEGKELPRIQPLPALGLHLVVSALPRQKDTRTLIRLIRDRQESQPGPTGQALHALGSLAGQVLQKNRGQNARDWGSITREAQGILSGLGLSLPELDLFLAEAVEEGALGGKLSGAGGGGAFFLIAENHEAALRLAGWTEQWFCRHSINLMLDPLVMQV